MRILGIDPGVATTGFGIVDWKGRKEGIVVHYGFIGTPSDREIAERLGQIFRELNEIIEVYQPQEVAVEELFFNKNSKTAISVGEARGVALLCAELHQLPVYGYTPLQIKQAVVGYGKATKNQVIYMVRQLLGIAETITPDDVADALAVALCHAFLRRIEEAHV